MYELYEFEMYLKIFLYQNMLNNVHSKMFLCSLIYANCHNVEYLILSIIVGKVQIFIFLEQKKYYTHFQGATVSFKTAPISCHSQ